MKIKTLSSNPDLYCKLFIDENGCFIRFKKKNKTVIEKDNIKDINLKDMKLKLISTKNLFIISLTQLYTSLCHYNYDWIDDSLKEHIKNVIEETKNDISNNKLSLQAKEKIRLMQQLETLSKKKEKIRYAWQNNATLATVARDNAPEIFDDQVEF